MRNSWLLLPRRRLTILLVLLVCLPCLRSLRWNLSPSAPRGLYRISRARPSLDTLVAVCPPPHLAGLALSRRYVHRGSCRGAAPLLKRVLALPGQWVVVTRLGLYRDGQLVAGSRPLIRDRLGRRLIAQPLGHQRLPPGTVWCHGGSARSWDSRYFGPVPQELVLSTVRPILTLP